MSEIEQLQSEIKELESQLQPKQKRLTELRQARSEEIKKLVELSHKAKHSFKPEELIYAAHSRCSCGAGLAYPEGIGPWGAWHCSAILTGTAEKNADVRHDESFPFNFYEIKSENQPSAYGETTRPDVDEDAYPHLAR